MGRYHVQRALRAANVSALECNLALGGALLIAVAVVTTFAAEDAGGARQALGAGGLLAIALCAASRGARLYRAGTPAALPAAVGRVAVRVRPARAYGLAAVTLALGLPLAAAVAALVLIEWAWLPLTGVLLVGCAAGLVAWLDAAAERDWTYAFAPWAATELLQRLCARAGLPEPELVVEHGAVANAWTTRGRIHVTTGLLELLERDELEAVLAHELAHLARRDAAVMEICSAPSRLLLRFAGTTTRRLPRWTVGVAELSLWPALVLWALAVLCVPPAVVIGWAARLSVLGASRARELAADAGAAALTGRPSALASALLKLERGGHWTPGADLRAVDVLCIAAPSPSRFGRLLATHPPTAVRVRRLEAMEAKLPG